MSASSTLMDTYTIQQIQTKVSLRKLKLIYRTEQGMNKIPRGSILRTCLRVNNNFEFFPHKFEEL